MKAQGLLSDLDRGKAGMKGQFVQDKNETWHLIWDTNQKDRALAYTSWCHQDFDVDAPRKAGSQISFMDIVHDECVRKSEELE